MSYPPSPYSNSRMESSSKNSYRQSGVAAYLFLMEVSDDSSK